MDAITDIPGMAAAIQTFSRQHGQHLPTAATAPMTGNPAEIFDTAASLASMVQRVNDVAECLYAFHGQIADPDAKTAAMTLCAQAAVFPGYQGWMPPIALDNRGAKISWAMRRELGETAPAGTAWPTPDQDPAVLEIFVQPAPLTPAP